MVLTDKGCLKPLCELPFIGMEEEVGFSVWWIIIGVLMFHFCAKAEQVMEQKARSVDVTTPRYYELLYCYHIAHNSFLKGRFEYWVEFEMHGIFCILQLPSANMKKDGG